MLRAWKYTHPHPLCGSVGVGGGGYSTVRKRTHSVHKLDGLSCRANTPRSLFTTTLDAQMERHLSTLQMGNETEEGEEEEDGLGVMKQASS